MTHCPKCGSDNVHVNAGRAWCLRPYSAGGCGGFYTMRGRRWVRHRFLSGD